MSSGAFRRFLASLAAPSSVTLLALSLLTPELRAGGCGCEAPPCQTVYKVRGHHHCRSCPPVGMVVQSMPVMPMMAAPMMMAPVMPMAMAPVAVAPPMAVAPQPTMQLSLAAPAAAPTCMSLSQEQLVRALATALANENAGVGAARSANMSTEDRLADLERRVARLEGQTKTLEGNTKDIVELLKLMQQKAGN